VGEQRDRLARLERHGCTVTLHAWRAEQPDVEAHGVTIGALGLVSSRFRVRNANRTPLGDAVGMTSTSARPVAPWKVRLPWVMLAVTTAFVAATVPLSLGHEPLFDTVFYGLQVLTLAAIGALVAARQTSNPIGWIFCAQGFIGGLLEFWGEGLEYHNVPMSTAGEWIIQWWWVVDGAAYAVVFLLFPTGRLLSPRWRWVLWLLAGAVLLAVPGQSLTTRNPTNPVTVDSPVVETMLNAGLVLLLAGIAGAVAALFVRFRRASGLERLQLKALVFAGAVTLPSMALAAPFYYASVLVQIVIAVALLLLPVAAGLAILRYRLYNIDVVINRTVVYGALSAILAAIYLGSVLLFQLALSPFTEGSALAVAVSTLTVAALFRPVRARIQHVVDRRFFRRKYDANQTLEQFSSHLRDQVDLADIGTDLLAVVGETVQPTHASLWLRKQAID
jgi:hypothetical protein